MTTQSNVSKSPTQSNISKSPTQSNISKSPTQSNITECENIQVQISVISTVIDFFTLFCTFATFIVAMLAYRSIVKNKLQEEQLKAILSLIKYFKNKKFHTQFINDQGKKLDFLSGFDLFTLSSLNQIPLTVNSVDYQKIKDIWISLDDLQFFQDITNCEFHLLLPKVIAQKLKRFWIHSPDVKVVARNLANGNNLISCVVIADDPETQSGQIYNVSDFLNEQLQSQEASAFTSWATFITTYQDLIKEIRNWMISHGISDLNI